MEVMEEYTSLPRLHQDVFREALRRLLGDTFHRVELEIRRRRIEDRIAIEDRLRRLSDQDLTLSTDESTRPQPETISVRLSQTHVGFSAC